MLNHPRGDELNLVVILRLVRERLSDPKRWTKNTYAKDKDGEHVYSCSERACRWCLSGAIMVEEISYAAPRGLTYNAGLYVEELRLMAEQMGLLNRKNEGLHMFNDRSTHEQVLAFLDSALQLLG